ncbi:MAG TPA: hypothetical protein ENN34_12485 [Deltaproteobacteria bacterium]|nr:hypothetical protein [Deltaproteobacteria bacterium]
MPGSLVLQESIPALSVGRHVMVSVLSHPRQGLVLVSLFGKQFLVETTLNLKKGEVLNLRVHATSPKVVLKPSGAGAGAKRQGIDLSQIIERLVGTFPGKSPDAFALKEILARVPTGTSDDQGSARVIHSLLDQITQDPQALVHLFVPVADRDSRGHARVSITKQGQGYVLHFRIETDFLGPLECLVRLDDGIEAEIRSGSQEVVDLLREHVLELQENLGRFGLRRIEIVWRSPEVPSSVQGVDLVI